MDFRFGKINVTLIYIASCIAVINKKINIKEKCSYEERLCKHKN